MHPETETIAVASLVLDEHNPRTMPAKQLADLRRSLERFGVVEPIVARRSDRLVIGGHQRIEAARALGLEAVPVICWEGSDAEARALNLALNKIDGDWDRTKLAQALADLAAVESFEDALKGFDPALTELAGFDAGEVLAALEAELRGTAPGEDLATLIAGTQPRREPLSVLGEGYALGRHRLLCADARKGEAVARLCAELTPALLFTDPPYNVDYRAEVDASGRASSGRRTGRRVRPLGPIANDDLSPDDYQGLLEDALTNASAILAPGAPVYVCGGSSTTTAYDAAFAAAGFVKSAIIIWDKGTTTLGRKDYQSHYELIWYGWKAGAAHSFFGTRSECDIWELPRDPSAYYLHPTQKPVALAARAIANSTKPGATVLDLFAGSGTTLTAAEEEGRSALLLERDPAYVDIIVARWEALSGERAQPWRTAEAPHG